MVQELNSAESTHWLYKTASCIRTQRTSTRICCIVGKVNSREGLDTIPYRGYLIVIYCDVIICAIQLEVGKAWRGNEALDQTVQKKVQTDNSRWKFAPNF